MNNLRTTILLAVIVLFTACSKQKQTTLVGQWESVVYYFPDASGNLALTNPVNYSETLSFEASGRFTLTTDVPAGTGKYQWSPASTDVVLQFEADNYGNPSRTEKRQIEQLEASSLTITQLDASGNLQVKTVYHRKN
ncbi:MAG: hypothetical protein JNL59_13440 [Chitinophagaceae bacterium]|nr:hypothetical protein [Chitinophagaceae bacterium]